MPTTVTKPPILDETGIDIVAQIKRIADAKEANLMGYGGAITFSNLPSPTSSNLGLFYLITDAFTTTSDFVVGAGVSEPAGKYWAVINIGTQVAPVCKYDEMGTLVDLSAKQDKTLSSPINVDGISQTTVEGTLGAINTLAGNNKTSLSSKQNKDLTTSITIDGSVQTTVEGALGAINTLAAGNKTNIGTLNSLTTTNKTDLVSAINEVNSSSGGYWLTTQKKTLIAGDTTAQFTLPNVNYAYDVYTETADGSMVSLTSTSLNGTTFTVAFSAITSAQAGNNGATMILRVLPT